MHKIQYKDISTDKENLLKVIGKMIPIYKKMQHHTQVLECEQWVLMLSRKPIQTEYTSNAVLALKNILNDCANICLSYYEYDLGNIATILMDKVGKLFKQMKYE